MAATMGLTYIEGVVSGPMGIAPPVTFLVDSGADRTVFSAMLVAELGHPNCPAGQPLDGVGGFADCVVVETQLRLFTVTDAVVGLHHLSVTWFAAST